MERQYSPGMQLLILFAIIFGMGILGSSIFILALNSAYPSGLNETLVADPFVNLYGAFVSQLFSHLLGFWIFLRVTKQSFKEVIDMDVLHLKKLLLIPVFLVVCFFGMSFLAEISSAIFEALGSSSVLQNEATRQAETVAQLTHQEPFRLILSLIALAILPAIGEEFIYRGILVKKITEATGNHHFSIIISGIIFGAIHFQPVPLFAIALMGILFGYIYYYTKNIWYSIIIHFLVNALQILAFYIWPNLMT